MPYRDDQRVEPLHPESDWRAHLAAWHPGVSVGPSTTYEQALVAHQVDHVAAAIAGEDVGHFHGAARVDRAPRFR